MQTATISHAGREVRLFVHDDEYISNFIRAAHSFFELEILEYLRLSHPRQRTVLDIGANIGNHALFFAKFFELERLVCFEPFEPNYRLLVANVGDIAETWNVGLGSVAKKCGIRFNPQNLGICVLDDQIPGDISVRPLDSFNFENVTLIKSDVEEHHTDVLEGARKTIERCQPLLVVEGERKDLDALLAPLNYRCTESWKKYDTYCFAPLSEAVMPRLS